MNPFPAVMVGGPPRSGKSVLVHSLTRQLRDQKVDHYVIRACPDGEGDYSNEADQDLVRLIRQKGAFTSTFVQHVSAALANRILPLLVDVGGKPTPDQEVIFSIVPTRFSSLGRRRNWRNGAHEPKLMG